MFFPFFLYILQYQEKLLLYFRYLYQQLLIEYFEGTENPINEFEESVFEFLIEKIAVINQTELEFQIIGGLKFKEKI